MSNHIRVGAPVRSSLTISISGSQPAITFDADGGVTFHEGYPVSELARLFWTAMANANPLRNEVERLKEELAIAKGEGR